MSCHSAACGTRKCSQPITNAVMRVYDEPGNVIETRRARGRFQTAVKWACQRAAF